MSVTVSEFNNSDLKREISQSSEMIQDYIRSMNGIVESANETNRVAIERLRELSTRITSLESDIDSYKRELAEAKERDKLSQRVIDAKIKEIEELKGVIAKMKVAHLENSTDWVKLYGSITEN